MTYRIVCTVCDRCGQENEHLCNADELASMKKHGAGDCPCGGALRFNDWKNNGQRWRYCDATGRSCEDE